MNKQVEQRFRNTRTPLTLQRRAVVDALWNRHDHPTADELFADLQVRLPGISRPTVYRVLNSLVRMGIARKVCHPGAAARFETRVSRHHHLVCVRCDKVVDFEPSSRLKVSLPDASRHGFRLDDYSIHFRGVCADCMKLEGQHPRKRARRTTRRG